MERARIIAEAAAHISQELGAAAIMVSGDLSFEGIETGEVPVYYISMRPKSIIDHLVATSKDGKKILQKSSVTSSTERLQAMLTTCSMPQP